MPAAPVAPALPEDCGRQQRPDRERKAVDTRGGQVESGDMRLASALPQASEAEAISWITFAPSTAAGARAREPPASRIDSSPATTK
jgi:hypothetical protein